MKAIPKLPSLPALRAFEAAARHQSVARAAEELFVTHGAVSHQIKALEEQLGYALFSKQGRGIVTTPEGKRLAAVLNRALGDIGQEIEKIHSERSRPRLVVTTVSSFAARWLTPRLGRFLTSNPEVELWIQSSKRVENLAAEGIDLAIRLGPGNWPDVYAQPFMDECYLVVASPNLVGGLPQTPQELLSRPLLRSDTELWQPWFAHAGLDWPEPQNALVFSDSGLVVQAALEGQGIALSRWSLVADELAAGRLQTLFDVSLPFTWRYYLVTQRPGPYCSTLQRFVDWLHAEARASIESHRIKEQEQAP